LIVCNRLSFWLSTFDLRLLWYFLNILNKK
jgi:hypothetical protein